MKNTEIWPKSSTGFSYVVPVKSKVEILQNFVAFSGYINFTKNLDLGSKLCYF